MAIAGNKTDAKTNATEKTFFKKCFLNPIMARSAVRI